MKIATLLSTVLPNRQFSLQVIIFTSHIPRLYSHKPRGRSILYFSTRLSLSTMSTEPSENAIVGDENAKYGFARSEMYGSSLRNTVDPYGRHVFLCYKSHDAWPSRIEDTDADPLPKLLASAIKARRNEMNVKTRLTICEGGDEVKLSDGDVLIFPEMVIYRCLKESEVDGFVDDVLVGGKPWASGIPEKITGSYVFVCAHNNRDRRCGVCGPVLIEKFVEEIGIKSLTDQVHVTPCSHVGGHKYAGNVIVFSADAGGKIVGNWYGYVTPDDVGELLDKQIGKGEIIERIWRGQMGTDVVKESEKDGEPKAANGSHREKEEESQDGEKAPESAGGCCQGANGFSCCRDENAEQKPVKKAMGGFSFGKLEQNHLLTGVAVAGAVAAVVVAYSVYRKSR